MPCVLLWGGAWHGKVGEHFLTSTADINSYSCWFFFMQQVASGATGNYRQMEDTGFWMELVQHAEHHHKYVFICTLLWSVMHVACVSCCLIFLLNYKKTPTHRSSWVVAPFFSVASDSSYISFKTYAHFFCIPQCKHVKDAGIYWRKRTLQSCSAEGGTGGPEKIHLWVKGSHSAFHSQKAVGFAQLPMEALNSAFAFSEGD